MQNQVVHYCYQ